MHTITKVDSTFPEGDNGGNRQSIPNNGTGVKNLHSLWDSLLYRETIRASLPLSEEDWARVTTEAEKLDQEYEIDESLLYLGDFTAWAREGFDIAVDTAHGGFVKDEPVS